MGKFFSLDSPLMRGLGKMADLLWLNLLTFICCIPIVTAGASLTAMHYVCLKMARDEEGYITKDFFKSFKTNLGQSTVIWLIVLVISALLIVDFYYAIYRNGMNLEGTLGTVYKAVLIVASILFFCVCTLVFPIQAHFINPIKTTFKNAFLMSIFVLPKTVIMFILNVLPIALFCLGVYFPQINFIIPLTVIFWFSGPAYLSALLYSKTFKRFEPETEGPADDMDFTISKKEVDEINVDEDAANSDILDDNAEPDSNEGTDEAVATTTED